MEILGAVVAEASKAAAKFLFSRIAGLVKFHGNVGALRKELVKLASRRKEIDDAIALAELEGKFPLGHVEEWLQEAEETIDEANSLLEFLDDDSVVNGCSLQWNMLYRHHLSKVVSRKLCEVKQLIDVCNFQTVAPDGKSPEKAVDRISVPSLVGQKAASRMLQQLLLFLNDDSIRRVAVWGMGGVGKTTLVKNLNNHLETLSIRGSYDMVIWVQVPKDLDLRDVQSQIAKKLNLELEAGESLHVRASRLLRRLMKKKKLLLIFDDVWKKIDLDAVGVPQGNDHPCCKILLTTQSFDVCREMMTDAKLKVDFLSQEDAWNLFAQSAGYVVELEGIRPLAKAIVEECCGLPLAIKTMGTSMRDKTKIELWQNALCQLRRSVPFFKTIENEVFRHLSFSYVSLQNKILQQCFLYCSLYPENFSVRISELIQCWVADGLINEHQTLEESFNNGIALIEHLKDYCLLEHGEGVETVKMHGVVRDVAIWLSPGEEDFGFFFQSDNSLHEMKLQKSTKRVSFVGKKITKLPGRLLECSSLTVLFLQGNPIKKIPDEFFHEVRALRVLNLSGTHIASLPLSLLNLGELRTLILRDCCNLEKLPSLEALNNLRVLDLSGSRLKQLTKGIGYLPNLRELNLASTYYLEDIEAGTISAFSNLEAIDMSASAYNWDMNGLAEEQRATFDELLSLECLSVLHVRLYSVDCLPSNSDWLRKLRKFTIQIYQRGSEFGHLPTEHGEKRVILRGVDLLGGLEGLLRSASALDLVTCGGISGLSELASRGSLCGLASLKSLTITSFDCFINLISRENIQQSMLPNLEHLRLISLRNLKTILDGVVPNGVCLGRLRTIEVVDCPKLRNVIPYALRWHVKNLEEIKASNCHNMTCIIKGGESNEALPKLRVIELKDLIKLRTICSKSTCPLLQCLEVSNCPMLEKLPLSPHNAATVTEIRGDLTTWNNLKWEDDRVKTILQHRFQVRELPHSSQEKICLPFI